MNTPVYDFLEKYSHSDTLRCHMPGHKGKAFFPELSALYSLDITEIKGADSLFEADGIIAQSEKNSSRLYGSAGTVFSAGGSTLCIQTMLAVMKSEKRRVIAVRNVHRAFLNAVALLDIDVEWIIPEYSGGILSGNINLGDVEKAFEKNNMPSALYITSPDYTGKIADIKALAEICHRHNARLIVDNAHGSHLKFLKPDIHPISLGADMCCDSAHKMLPALTGSAMLHTSVAEYVPVLKQKMTMFASTSPSYLIMLSLDLCNRYIAENITHNIEKNLAYIEKFRNDFSEKIIFAESEPFHITIQAEKSGYCGNQLAELMRTKGVECEYSDSSLVILLMSPMCEKSDYERLSLSLDFALKNAGKKSPRYDDFNIELPEKAMTVREAVFSECEEIAVEEAMGRICASVKVPCPPAVPIVASGERIDIKSINIFRKYGISSVIVVK